MNLGGVELMHVADQRPAVWARQVVKGPCRRVGRRTLLEPRDVDKDAAIALDDRTRCETFRPTFALPGTDRETPTVIATDERAAVEFPLTEQRALMRTTAFERAPVAPRLHQHDVRFVCGQSKGTIAVEFTELRDANECLGLHDRSSHRTTSSDT
jgi:hypothetical protein